MPSRCRIRSGHQKLVERADPAKIHPINHRPDPFLIDEEPNPLGFDEMYDRATRKVDFVVIYGDTGEDIPRILPPSCLRMA